jgi:hypothetical protein
VTIAKRPFVWAGMAEDVEVIWVKWEREYFWRRDWTTQITWIRLDKFAVARKAVSQANQTPTMNLIANRNVQQP